MNENIKGPYSRAQLECHLRNQTVANGPVAVHFATMTWLAEILIQGFWDGVVELSYRKWGLLGGAAALLGPFIIGGLLLWLIFG